MRSADFLGDHANWLIAFVCFCFAFSGICAQTIWWFPYRPFEIDWPEKYLSGRWAVIVGIIYLVVGFAVLFNPYLGVVGLVGALLLTWFLGNFVHQGPSK